MGDGTAGDSVTDETWASPDPDAAPRRSTPPASPPAYGPPAYGPPVGGAPGSTPPAYGRPAYGPPPGGPPAYDPRTPPPSSYGPPTSAPPSAYGRPGYAQPAFPGQPAGWTPPPKPGLIPLAPLTFGTILGAPYRAFRRNPRPTFGMSLLIQGGVLFLTILVIGLVAFASFSRVDFASNSAEQDEIAAGAFGVTALSSLIPIALSLLATGVMQGVISLEISRQSLGEKLTFSALWRRARGRLIAVGLYVLALTGVAAIGAAVLIGIAVIPFVLGGTAGIGVGIGLVIMMYLGVIVVAAWIGTKLAFVPSVIVLERLGIGAAVARSWSLTRGAFWRIFGTLLLVGFILSIAVQVVSQVPIFAGAILASLLDPTAEGSTFFIVIGVAYLVAIVLTLVISAVTLVVQSGTATLLYLDRRIRLEGLDLELQQFVEARQAGATGLADPYESAVTRRTGRGAGGTTG